MTAKNGKRIAKLSSDTEDKITIAKSLIGILPSDATLAETEKEGLKQAELAKVIQTLSMIIGFLFALFYNTVQI